MIKIEKKMSYNSFAQFALHLNLCSLWVHSAVHLYGISLSLVLFLVSWRYFSPHFLIHKVELLLIYQSKVHLFSVDLQSFFSSILVIFHLKSVSISMLFLNFDFISWSSIVFLLTHLQSILVHFQVIFIHLGPKTFALFTRIFSLDCLLDHFKEF